jgi:hypothetical protein
MTGPSDCQHLDALNRLVSSRIGLVYLVIVRIARDRSSRNKLHRYVVCLQEYRRLARRRNTRLRWGREVQRAGDDGLPMLHSGTRETRGLGPIRRPKRSQNSETDREVGLQTGNTYIYSVKYPRSDSERYMRAAPMDLRSLSQSYMTLVKFEAERTNRIVTRVGR